MNDRLTESVSAGSDSGELNAELNANWLIEIESQCYCKMLAKSKFISCFNHKLMLFIKSSLDPWQAHFNAILNGDDTKNCANELIRPQLHHQIGKKWPLPFNGLLATKPAVMMACLHNFLKQKEMSELVSCMLPLCNIWSLKSMPSD